MRCKKYNKLKGRCVGVVVKNEGRSVEAMSIVV